MALPISRQNGILCNKCRSDAFSITLLQSMRIKYLHAFSLDRCQFPSGGAAAPLDHARFVAAPQGYTYPAQPARVDFAVF